MKFLANDCMRLLGSVRSIAVDFNLMNYASNAFTISDDRSNVRSFHPFAIALRKSAQSSRVVGARKCYNLLLRTSNKKTSVNNRERERKVFYLFHKFCNNRHTFHQFLAISSGRRTGLKLCTVSTSCR